MLRSVRILFVFLSFWVSLDLSKVQAASKSLEIKIAGSNAKTCNHIEWITLSELSGSMFYLEASANGKDFETIGIIKGKGDQTADNKYVFDHQNVQNNITYYRIKETYPGGTFKYSLTIMLQLNDVEEQVYPNPAMEFIMISGFSGKKFSISDRSGRLVSSGTCESANYQVNISMLESGNYFILIEEELKPVAIWFSKF